MREEISEPQQWRAGTQQGSSRNHSWTTRRRSQGRLSEERAKLTADAVDAALSDDTPATPAVEKLASVDFIASLANQLDLLEKQREQLQQMLDQVQESPSH